MQSTSSLNMSERDRDLLHALTNSRVDNTVCLPQIAVMGDTSAGKSSLLTALSTIQFPSNSTLTTRCATEVRMTTSTSFVARVSIRRHTMIAAAEPAETKANVSVGDASEPNGGWENGQQSTLESTELKSVEEVKQAIEAKTIELTAGMTGTDISKDTIVIDLHSPGVPNLTVVDLPGLVATTGDGDSAQLPAKIKNLLESFMSKPRTIILAVIPACDNFHNQSVLEMASTFDPHGERTLGVITKADTAPQGAEDEVIQLLLNKKKKLYHGYHAVRLWGQDDLNRGMGLDAALDREAVFFDQGPWAQVDKNLVGIPALRRRLESLLSERVAQSLPGVRRDVEEKLRDVEEELKTMGNAPTTTAARRTIFSHVVRKSVELLHAALDGTYNGPFFNEHKHARRHHTCAHIRTREQKFHDAVVETRFPCVGHFAPQDRVVCSRNDTTGTVISLSPDGTHMFVLVDGAAGNISVPRAEWSPQRDELMGRLREKRGKALTGFGTYNVFMSIVAEELAPWRGHMTTYCQNVLDLILQLLEDVLETTAAQVPALSDWLLHQGRTILRGTGCGGLFGRLMEEASRLLDGEKDNAYALNSNYAKAQEEKRSDPFLAALDALDTEGKEGEVPLGSVKVLLKQFGRAGVSNEEKEAIELEFALAAYLPVAAERFAEDIPRLMRSHLLRAFKDNVEYKWYEMSDTQLDVLIHEPTRARARREALVAQEETLRLAMEAFHQHARGAGM